MVEKYLKPINMEHLAKIFVESKITGTVLMSLEVSGLTGLVSTYSGASTGCHGYA